MSKLKLYIESVEVGRSYKMEHEDYGTIYGTCTSRSAVRQFTVRLIEPNKKLADSFKKVGDLVNIDVMKLTSMEYHAIQLDLTKSEEAE